MFEWLFRLVGARISPESFERSVFGIVTRRITDKRAVEKELESVWNLAALHQGSERENRAAHCYLSLEDHIANGQATRRLPREILRELVFRRCHPDRADGNFPLLFLTRYAREIRLYELFTEEFFRHGSQLLPAQSYREVLDIIQQKGNLDRVLRNGQFSWPSLERRVRRVSGSEQVKAVQGMLKDGVEVLTRHLVAAIDNIRTELLLREIYNKFREDLNFLDDVPTMLLLVPQEFLYDERLALMGRPELEKRLLQKSEELEATLTQLRDEEGRISSMTREELEKKVQERTADLRKALEDVKRGRANLEEFTSLATHELRAPIGIVKGYATLLLDGNAGAISDQQRHFISQIKDAIERQLELVNAMLNASRIELGTLAIDPEPTNIPELVDKVIEELVPQTEAKQIEVAKSYEKKIPMINADPRLMRAVVQNLLTNAVKYTQNGGSIAVVLEKRKDDLMFSVSDTGYGIPQEQQSKIFAKLFRADNVRTLQIEGTGLGLYIVKSVLEQAGGKIWFESPAPGRDKEQNPGTAFYVSIPLSGMTKKEGFKGLS